MGRRATSGARHSRRSPWLLPTRTWNQMSEPHCRLLQCPCVAQMDTASRTTTMVMAHARKQRHMISLPHRVDISMANSTPPTCAQGSPRSPRLQEQSCNRHAPERAAPPRPYRGLEGCGDATGSSDGHQITLLLIVGVHAPVRSHLHLLLHPLAAQGGGSGRRAVNTCRKPCVLAAHPLPRTCCP
jgi:hypothetical protein